MTDPKELLARVRAGLDGVTEGPWTQGKRTPTLVFDAATRPVLYRDAPFGVEAKIEANARFIAAARSDVPALADELEAVMKERDSFRAVLEGARYSNIDGIAKNDPEFSHQLGEAVMELTIARMKRAEAAEAEAASLKAEVARLRADVWEEAAKLVERMHFPAERGDTPTTYFYLPDLIAALRAKKEAGE